MKLCCCSRSYARALQSGALTQLEWIDRCTELRLDGVEFGASHFPRTDADYLAQLKKLCADRGLTVASVAVDVTFGDGDIDSQAAELLSWIDHASALASPLVRFACGAATGSPGVAWRELVRGLKHVCVAAKDRNVTLAMSVRESTLVASGADAKRAIKECDSAWLRLALALSRFDLVSEIAGEAVIAVASGALGEEDTLKALRADGYIGFVSLETAGADEDAAVRDAMSRLRLPN